MFDKKTSFFDRLNNLLYYFWGEYKAMIIIGVIFALCMFTGLHANGEKIDPSIVSQNVGNSTIKLQWYIDNYKDVTNENRILSKQLADYLKQNYDLKLDNTKKEADIKILQQQIKSEFIVNIPFTNIGIKKDHVIGGLCMWLMLKAFGL